MSVITNTIRWASNTAELKAAISQGTGSIVAMKDAVDRTTRSLGGEGLFRAANNTTAAVMQLGGASRLTASEKAKVNAQLTKAIEKYGLIGQQAPKAMLDLAAATQATGPPTTTLTQRMVTLGAAVGSFLGNFAANLVQRGISSIISMGVAAFNSAGQILDLANKTGLSTQTIQRMQFVADQTGGSIKQFTDLAFQLSKRLGTGKGNVQGAVADLGLSFQALQQMTPDQQFMAIITALGGVTSATERARLGSLLFSDQFREIAAAVTEGYEDIAAGARVSGEAQLRALDAASDRLTAFTSNTKSGITSILGNFLLMADAFASAGSKWTKTVKETGDIALNVTQDVGSATQNYTQQLAAAKAEVTALTTEQRAEIVAAQQLGVKTDELTASFGVSEAALKFVTEETKNTEKATIAATKALEQFGPTFQELHGPVVSYADQLKALTKEQQNFTLAMQATAQITPGMAEGLRALANEAMGLTRDGLIPSTEHSREMTEQLALSAVSITQVSGAMVVAQQSSKGMIDEIARGPSIWGQSFGFLKDIITNTSKTLGDIQEKVTGSLSKLFGGKEGGILHGIIGSGMNAIFGPASGLISSLVSQGMAKMGEIVWSGLKKIGGFFKSLFGGPSAQELGGREIARAFEQTVNEMFDLVRDRVEPAQGQWQRNNILLREAYIALGMDGPAAISKTSEMLTRLHQAEKQGAGATRQVMEEIIDVLTRGLQPAAKQTADDMVSGFQQIRDTGEHALTSVARTGVVSFETIESTIQRLKVQAIGSENTGLIEGIVNLERKMHIAAQQGVTDFGFMSEAIQQMKLQLGTPITIPITTTGGLPSGGGGGGGGTGGGGGSTPFNQTVMDRIMAFAGPNGTDPGDYHRIPRVMGISESALHDLGIPGFLHGTDRVRDSGLAFVHAGERITPETQARTEDTRLDRLTERVDALMGELRAQRRAMRGDLFVAIRDGVAHART